MTESETGNVDHYDIIKKLGGLYKQLTLETNINYTKECVSEAIQEIMALRNQLDLLTLLLRREYFNKGASKNNIFCTGHSHNC